MSFPAGSGSRLSQKGSEFRSEIRASQTQISVDGMNDIIYRYRGRFNFNFSRMKVKEFSRDTSFKIKKIITKYLEGLLLANWDPCDINVFEGTAEALKHWLIGAVSSSASVL